MDRKKLLVSVLIAAAIATAAVFLWSPKAASAKHFLDVAEDHSHFFSVHELSKDGIVRGYGDGTFRPEQLVNRAEAATIVLKALGASVNETATTRFGDVAEGAWYVPYIAEAERRAFIQGYDDNTFRPEATIVFSESLAMVLRAFDARPAAIEGSPWYEPFVAYAREHLLFTPPDNGMLKLDRAMTRGEFAELAFRMRWVARNNKKPFDLAQQWNVLFKPENRFQIRYPKNWFVHVGQFNTTLYKPDYPAGQIWYTRLYPNGARLSLSYINRTGIAAQGFFDEMENIYKRLHPAPTARFESLRLGGRDAFRIIDPAQRIFDTYIGMPDGYFLVLYGEHGGGPLGWFLEKEMLLIGESFSLVAADAAPPPESFTIEERLEKARILILVENKGQEALSFFPDRRLIETDAIGAGRGPVDYYYSELGNATLKYERAGNILLDLREGETTSF